MVTSIPNASQSSEMFLEGVGLPNLDCITFNKRRYEDPTFDRNFPNNLTQDFLDKVNYQKNLGKNFIMSYYGLQGSTKSYSAMTLTGMSEWNLEIDNVFFKLEDIDKHTSHFHAGDVVLRDEWEKAKGVGSSRLEDEYALKIETLRKRQVSFVIVSVLPRALDYSFYFIQTLGLVDEKRKISYCELQERITLDTLGHLKVPWLGDIMGKKFVKAYEDKKDDYLQTVLHKKSVDYITDWANEIVRSEMFLKLEKQEKDIADHAKKGSFKGIPWKRLLEIVNDFHPELNRNTEARAVTDRIVYIGIVQRSWQPPR